MRCFVSEDGNAARIAAILDAAPLDSEAIETSQALDERLPSLLQEAGLGDASAAQTGQTAIAADTVQAIVDSALLVGAVVLACNFLLLALFLRALVAPLYLLAASVLSVAATLGLTTYVFQGLLGHSDLTYYVPFAAGVLLVSLGSDYNVFVAGRIWQETDRRPLREAIAFAAPRASRAISVAGIALAASFAMLAIVPIDGFREFAFMMSVGVLLETFLVRPVLIPALIVLFGSAGRLARPAAPRRGLEDLVVDAGDELAPADHLAGDATQPDVVAGVLGEEHLVARVDPVGLGADGGDDPRAAAGLGALRDDQAGPRLDVLVDRLDDQVVVERLERDRQRGGILHPLIVGSLTCLAAPSA